MSVSWQQSAFKHYQSDKHFSETLPTRWRQKSSGIDMQENYVTVTLCISHEWRFLIGCRPVQLGSRAVNRPLDRACKAAPCWDPLNHELRTIQWQTLRTHAVPIDITTLSVIRIIIFGYLPPPRIPRTVFRLVNTWHSCGQKGELSGASERFRKWGGEWGGVQICTNLIQSCS